MLGTHHPRLSQWVAAAVASGAVVAGTVAGGVLPAPAASAAAVPKRFKANSLTWTSAERGWVLGAAPCRPGGTRTCSVVATTTDGGSQWSRVGTVGARIAPSGESGVTDIRFATPTTGWAFGPDLYRTTDGGQVWRSEPIPGGGRQVLAIAAGSQDTYAVVSPCTVGTAPSCSKPLSLWRAPVATTAWRQVSGLPLPANYTASVAAKGRSVYVIDPLVGGTGKTDRFYASTNGTRFSTRPVPCASKEDIGLVQAVPTTATHVDLLCAGNPGFSRAIKTVYRSADTGRTDTSAGTTGADGIASDLAASRSGNLAVASASDGTFLYVNDTGKRAWTEAIADAGSGWNDLNYVSDTKAWVVYNPVNTDGTGQLLVSTDAGRQWKNVSL